MRDGWWMEFESAFLLESELIGLGTETWNWNQNQNQNDRNREAREGRMVPSGGREMTNTSPLLVRSCT